MPTLSSKKLKENVSISQRVSLAELKGAAIQCRVTNATADAHEVFDHVDDSGLRVAAVDGGGIAVVVVVVVVVVVG
jgi:hypothetical protein